MEARMRCQNRTTGGRFGARFHLVALEAGDVQGAELELRDGNALELGAAYRLEVRPADEEAPAPPAAPPLTVAALDGMTVDEVAELVATVEDPDVLETVQVLEHAGKQRKGVFEALAARADALGLEE